MEQCREHPLDVEHIRQRVQHLTIGRPLYYFPVIDSTNRVAKDLPWDTDWHGSVVAADFQTAGRGRRMRSWSAPPNSSLLLSVALKPPPLASHVHTVAIGGLAVTDALAEIVGMNAALKWPNDVVLNGRKVCGILAELARHSLEERVVLGIGLNLNFRPGDDAELPGDATTVLNEVGHPVNREDLAVALFRRLELWYRDLTRGTDGIYSVWESRLETLNRPVSVSDARGTWYATATAVQRDGSLVVRDDGGTIRIVRAADVSVRHI